MLGTTGAGDIDEETFLRYLHESSKLRQDGSVRPEAFLPMFNTVKQRMETSTFRLSAFSDLWEAGSLHCEGLRPVKAVAIVTGTNIHDSGLAVETDDDPPGHASIVGWAENSSENFKSHNKRLAQQIARLASCVRREI